MRFIDLQEGPNDPGIFKAVFFAGGPGSGKSYVANQLGLISRGLKVLNSDDALEFLMRKHDLSFEMPPEEQPQRDVARQRAKELTKKKQDMYLGGRLGLIIDGTAKDVDKMAKLKTELEAIGYQTMMVFVNTSLKTALQRNLLRDRKVPTDIVVQSHKQVQQNKERLADVFAPNFVEIANDDNPDFNTPLKRIDKFLDAPVTAQARDWISKASVQKSIAQEDVQGKPKVYVDMDGVLANFYAGVTAATGHEEPRALALQDIEDAMASFAGTDFFYTLPKYEQADQLIAMVNKMSGGDWYILSSPLKYDREGSAKHKAAWVKKYLKIQPRGMHFTGDKAQFATQPDGTPNILIDDYPKYLEKWTNAGGIGVKYKGHVGNISDVKTTLDQHLGNTKPVEEAKESRVNEIADKPYDYIQNVKTPLKRAYRFQTDGGQLYRVQALSRETPDIKNFGIKKSLEIHFDLTDTKTGKPNTGVTGTGDAVRVFSTVANILQKEVAEQNPPSIVIASKADDESRVKLYRTLARRATKLMPDYEVAGENTVTGADGNPYLTIELAKK